MAYLTSSAFLDIPSSSIILTCETVRFGKKFSIARQSRARRDLQPAFAALPADDPSNVAGDPQPSGREQKFHSWSGGFLEQRRNAPGVHRELRETVETIANSSVQIPKPRPGALPAHIRRCYSSLNGPFYLRISLLQSSSGIQTI